MHTNVVPLFVAFSCVPLLAAAQTKNPAPAEARLPVGRTHGHAGGTLSSQRIRDDGTRVLHGLQVKYGPRLQIREYSVYNDGRCEQLVQLYPNGNVFREHQREPNGDGREVIYSAAATETVAEKVIVANGQDIGPIKRQEILCHGTVKAGRRMEGTFLVQELAGFQLQWRQQEFKAGKLVKSKPFPLEKLALEEIPNADADEKWPWTMPHWP